MESYNALLEHRPITLDKMLSSPSDCADVAVQVGRKAVETFQNITAWEELPQWMKKDPYIRRGYRRQLDSFSACFASIFYLHNESINIWSHLVPTTCYLLALSVTDHSLIYGSAGLSRADNVVLKTFVTGSVACLTFSVRIRGMM